MGISIKSKRYSAKLGYFGYGRFRTVVAKQVSEEVGKHYAELYDNSAKARFAGNEKEYFEAYDKKTDEFVEKGILSDEVANFLYQADCDGSIDRKQAKMVYNLIKDCDDTISFGYVGRTDCATMKDMKLIFNDKTKVEWY